MAFLSGKGPFKPYGTFQDLFTKNITFRVQQGTRVFWTPEENRGACPFFISLTEHNDRVVLSTESYNMLSGERNPTEEIATYFKLFTKSSKDVQFVDGLFMRDEDGTTIIEVPFVLLDEVLKKFGILEEAREAAKAFVDKMKL